MSSNYLISRQLLFCPAESFCEAELKRVSLPGFQVNITDRANALPICTKNSYCMMFYRVSSLECLYMVSILRQTVPATKLVLIVPSGSEVWEAAIKLDVSGILCTKHWFDELAECLELINNGIRYISNVRSFNIDSVKMLLEDLSLREMEVLALVSQGMTAKEIADKLCTAESTVKSHKSKCRIKLNLISLSELYFFAERHRHEIEKVITEKLNHRHAEYMTKNQGR